MKLSQDITEFCQRLNYQFKDHALIIEALTHSSIASKSRPSNQRLEFLGDRVLGLIIAETLLERDPEAVEGQLAPRLNALVRKEACAEIAHSIDLGVVLKMGQSEMRSGGRKKTALLGDAMEAVIAAIYLDGGFEAARKTVLGLWKTRLKHAAETPIDAKTRLQEWAQAKAVGLPEYIDISRTGPDHAPVFHVEVRLSTGESASAKASSKRNAQQEAAQNLLEQIKT